MRYGAFYFLYYLCLSSGQGTCQADMNELGLIMNFIFCCQKTDLMELTPESKHAMDDDADFWSVLFV